MRTTDENILRLLEMLDNPDAYTEQEIHDIINHDEDTRETYRLMVEAKQSCRHHKNDEPVDVENAWKRFILSEKSKVTSEEFATQPTERPHSSFFTLHSSFQKMAASFIGVLLVSGIAFAAIHLVRQQQTTETTQTEVTPPTKEPVREPATTAPVDTFVNDTAIVQPVTYDNIPLEKMLPEIAAHYDAKVQFLNEEARGLRFRFVWNPQQGIDQVVSDLNRFERLTVTLNDKLITIE